MSKQTEIQKKAFQRLLEISAGKEVVKPRTLKQTDLSANQCFISKYNHKIKMKYKKIGTPPKKLMIPKAP